MDRQEFARKMYKEEVHHYDDYEKECLMSKSINADIGDGFPYGYRKLLIVLEELGELTQEVTKKMRNKGTYDGLLEEVADVTICLDYVRKLSGITDEFLQKAIDIKLERIENKLKDEGKFL